MPETEVGPLPPARRELMRINAARLVAWSNPALIQSGSWRGKRLCHNEIRADAIKFLVFRCKSDRDCFIVTTDAHKASLSGDVCPTDGDTLLRVGRFPELGDKRTAFDEGLARRAIEENGFYRFHSKTFDPVAEPPLAMP